MSGGGPGRTGLVHRTFVPVATNMPGHRGGSAGSAADAGRGDRPGGQAGGADRLATASADAVAALLQPDQRRVDLREMLPDLAEQGGGVLALVGDRGAFRIV